jgi:hypothetical protein
MSIVNNTKTLKIESENAWGMINGFKIKDKLHFVTIFTAHKNAWSLKGDFRKYPKIITLIKKRRPEYPTNPLFADQYAIQHYRHQLKYIAVLDRIFHINSDLQLWERLCNNGIFNIWDSRAPFHSLENKIDQMILLFRIFEVDRDFSNTIQYGNYFDTVPKENFSIIRPLIPQNNEDQYAKNYSGAEYFDDIVKKLQDSVANHLRNKGEEIVRNTSKIFN